MDQENEILLALKKIFKKIKNITEKISQKFDD